MKPKGINFIEKFLVFNTVCTLGLCVVFISIEEGVGDTPVLHHIFDMCCVDAGEISKYVENVNS